MEGTESSPAERASLPVTEPVNFPAIEPTSDQSMDHVLDALFSIPGMAEPEQVGVYERLHDELFAELNAEQD